MWPVFLLLIVLAGVALHFGWRAKLRRERLAWRAEQARRDARELTAAGEALARQLALFDSMVEGVLVLDEADRVLIANRAFAQMFATVGSLQGRPMLEAVRLHELVGIVQRARVEGRVVDHELQLPGEPSRWLQINAATINTPDRRPLGNILVFHDLTRLKQLERLRQEFVANVSHELRTPLAMIKGYVETLLGGAMDDAATARRFLQTVERHADRLTLLIEDLLVLSSLESGQMRLRRQPVDLAGLVAKVFADFKPRAAGREMVLASDLAAFQVQADPDRLQQVLGNLVDNAIKYGRPQGRVVVVARETGTGEIEVCVQDDGPGIPAGAGERIFERFYRVDGARSREQGGTGLGLAIVKHIVQAHGGRIWVSSEPGRGAAFFFTLPPAEKEPVAAEAGDAVGVDPAASRPTPDRGGPPGMASSA